MVKIETKDKGDTGLFQIMSDLDKHNIKIALPISEHLPFDLIAINSDAKLAKVSVKYSKLKKDGIISIPLRTISSNSKGYKIKLANLTEIDGFAVFCPDTKLCYYIPSHKLSNVRSEFSLRVNNSPTNKNANRINWSQDYLNPSSLFIEKADTVGLPPTPVLAALDFQDRGI